MELPRLVECRVRAIAWIETYSGTEMRLRSRVVDVRFTCTVDDDGHEGARAGPKCSFSRPVGIPVAIRGHPELVEEYSAGRTAVLFSRLIRRRLRSRGLS